MGLRKLQMSQILPSSKLWGHESRSGREKSILKIQSFTSATHILYIEPSSSGLALSELRVETGFQHGSANSHAESEMELTTNRMGRATQKKALTAAPLKSATLYVQRGLLLQRLEGAVSCQL